jgi:hypothetical protein
VKSTDVVKGSLELGVLFLEGGNFLLLLLIQQAILCYTLESARVYFSLKRPVVYVCVCVCVFRVLKCVYLW